MMIAYCGLDGSGKTYHMAEVCQRMVKSGIDCFGSTPFSGARLLDNHRQLLRIERAHIFFDEWHQDHDAKEWYNLDPVLRHIVTQHRKYKLVIHWSAQHFKFMDSYVRRETTFIWEHEALLRDPDTGVSRVNIKIPFRERVYGMHRAWKFAALEAELNHRAPKILEKKTFFIKASIFNTYDSYKKIMLTAKHVSDSEIDAIKDPYNTPIILDPKSIAEKIKHRREVPLMPTPEQAEHKERDTIGNQNTLDDNYQSQNGINLA